MLKRYLFVPFALAILLSCNTKKEAESDLAWKAKADSLINLTFDTLRNTLLKAVSEKGFAGAIAFCNTEATGLTNIYATEKITIRRSSDRARNTANAPDSFEQKG
ncbi:MAG TPA: hypothetical protein VI461_16535, partial [Chitinophagaceae bacterium]|nr:hypothetical protein [Chitinophagaceae bacterium]